LQSSGQDSETPPASRGGRDAGFLPGALVLLSAALGAAALEAACAQSTGADLGPGVVALVEGEEITADDLRTAYWASSDDVRARAGRAGGRHYLLDLVVADVLLAHEARARSLAPRYSDVHGRHQKLMTQFLEAEFEPSIRPADVPEAVVRAEYERVAPELALPHRRHLRVLAFDDQASAEAMIDEISALVASDGLAGVERGIDDGTLRSRYGQDGLYNPDTAADELGEDVAAEGFTVDAAAVVVDAPVRYRGRWGVVIVREDFLAEPAPAYEEVAEQLRGRLYQDARERALNAFVGSFRGEHRVERHDEFLDIVPWVVVSDASTPRGADAGDQDREAGAGRDAR
jgi:hypothetical protein